MNEREVKVLLRKLSKEHNIPMPEFVFIERKASVREQKTPLGVRIVSRELDTTSYHTSTKDHSLILLSKTSRGVRKEHVVHEFFHYLDWHNNVEKTYT